MRSDFPVRAGDPAVPGFRACRPGTKSGTVSSSSTQIDQADGPRAYLLLQNTGTTNPMYVAIGSNNNAAVGDIYLQSGASLVFKQVPETGNIPAQTLQVDAFVYAASRNFICLQASC